MINRWFRMYVDFLDDPKIISLAYEDQRHFVGILCLKSAGLLDSCATETIQSRIVAQRLWIDYAIVEDVKARLMSAGLIDKNWQPLAWDKRQFKSDHDVTAAYRQRRYRDKHRNALHNALCNGDVTPVDTETDTEQRQKESTLGKTADAVIPPCPAEKIVDAYHTHLPLNPKVALLTKTRRGYLSQRWREFYAAGDFKTQEEGLSVFADFFAYVSKSRFLTGKVNAVGDRKPFIADLEWLIKPANFAKVIEGRYE